MPRWLVKHCLWVHLRVFPERTDMGVSGLGEEDPSLNVHRNNPISWEKWAEKGGFALSACSLLSLQEEDTFFSPAFGYQTTGSSTFGLWDLHQWLLGGIVRPDRDCRVSFPASRALNLD